MISGTSREYAHRLSAAHLRLRGLAARSASSLARSARARVVQLSSSLDAAHGDAFATAPWPGWVFARPIGERTHAGHHSQQC
jgi:hypothetical protein